MPVPVIDFSKLDGEERETILAQIANGCEEWGFFQLVNHGISEESLERVKRVCSDCYKLEREANFNNSKAVTVLKSMAENQTNGVLQTVDWEDVFTLLEDNEWPSNPPHFKETMKEYRRELKKLGEKIMEVMEENLGLQKGYMKKAFDGSGEDTAFFGTKVSHYPPCPQPELVHGLRSHTDAGGVILLFQDDAVGGLQILRDGEWIDVQPLPNTIVVNTGDQIEVLSNGRYKSVWHRVLATPNGNRISIASFYNPSLAATIAPAPELVGKEKETEEEKQPKYPKYVFGDYMSVYADQKFLPKEPRFKAVATIGSGGV